LVQDAEHRAIVVTQSRHQDFDEAIDEVLPGSRHGSSPQLNPNFLLHVVANPVRDGCLALIIHTSIVAGRRRVALPHGMPAVGLRSTNHSLTHCSLTHSSTTASTSSSRMTR